MLITLNPSYMRIDKESMPAEELERLTAYLKEHWIDFNEDSRKLVINRQTARLYMILYRLTNNFYIELN